MNLLGLNREEVVALQKMSNLSTSFRGFVLIGNQRLSPMVAHQGCECFYFYTEFLSRVFGTRQRRGVDSVVSLVSGDVSF